MSSGSVSPRAVDAFGTSSARPQSWKVRGPPVPGRGTNVAVRVGECWKTLREHLSTSRECLRDQRDRKLIASPAGVFIHRRVWRRVLGAGGGRWSRGDGGRFRRGRICRTRRWPGPRRRCRCRRTADPRDIGAGPHEHTEVRTTQGNGDRPKTITAPPQPVTWSFGSRSSALTFLPYRWSHVGAWASHCLQ